MKKWVIGLAFAVAGIAAGVTYAAIPASNGMTSGCYQKNNGQLRVVEDAAECHANSEVAITWNQQGPKGDKGDKGDHGLTGLPGAQGVQGDKGDKGDTGAPGAPGASAAYLRSNCGTCFTGVPEDGSQTEIVSVDLPAGLYAITAKGYMWNNAGERGVAASGNCDLFVGSGHVDHAEWQAPRDITPVKEAVALLGTANLAAPGSVHVMCNTLDPLVLAARFSILAVKVGSLG